MKYNSLCLAVCAVLFASGFFQNQAFAAAGDFYASLSNSGEIIRITPAGVTSSFATGVGTGLDLTFDPVGNLFLCQGGHQILKVPPAGGPSVFATNTGASAASDASGNIFASSISGAIVKYTASGTITTFASNVGTTFDLAFDAQGNLFSADFDSGAVYRFTPQGARTVAVTGLTDPTALAFDRLGNLFVADSFLQAIYKVAPDGSKTVFASGVPQISGMVCDTSESLFVIPFPGDVIWKFSPQGVKTTFLSGFSGLRAITVEPPTGFPLNVSTRVEVQTGDNAAIAGVIIGGTGEKRLIFRGIGPSLTAAGVAGALQDPTLELYRDNGVLIARDDDWRLADQELKQQTGLAPSDDRESAIVVTVTAPTSLTAVLRGKNNTTGIGLVEVYDLNHTSGSRLANISTRGVVGTGANVLIGGFIISGGSNGTGRVIVRAIGPSLADSGVAGVLSDPALSLRNANGSQIAANDDWRQTQRLEIEASGFQPNSIFESTIIATLPAGSYTAIVEGYQGATGVGLVEVYTAP